MIINIIIPTKETIDFAAALSLIKSGQQSTDPNGSWATKLYEAEDCISRMRDSFDPYNSAEDPPIRTVLPDGTLAYLALNNEGAGDDGHPWSSFLSQLGTIFTPSILSTLGIEIYASEGAWGAPCAHYQ